MTLFRSRSVLGSMIALTIVSAQATGSAASAAAGTPSQGPIIGVGIDRRQPPESCGPANDGETVVWEGWLWKCEIVLGAVPPWQWEPLWPV
jgi:hypothetical protein